MILHGTAQWWARISGIELAWIIIGFAAQIMLAARSWCSGSLQRERGETSCLTHFWYFSLTGGLLLTAYAVHRTDPVFVLGQVAALATPAISISFGLARPGEMAKEIGTSCWTE